jgi:hypothetical protein
MAPLALGIVGIVLPPYIIALCREDDPAPRLSTLSKWTCAVGYAVGAAYYFSRLVSHELPAWLLYVGVGCWAIAAAWALYLLRFIFMDESEGQEASGTER